jgi:hypothetical protein
MAERPDDRMMDMKMDAASVYKEEIYTDRKVGTIRVLVPVKSDGTPDTARKTLYMGEAQILTQVGALPVNFEIEATSLDDAITQYAPAAKEGVERTVRELQEMRRQQASSIVVPGAGGMGGMPGMGGGGKIQMP